MAAATLDDLLVELKKIKKLIKGQYHDLNEAEEQINKPE